ncbi:type IV pilus modification PilV family protein [Thiocystis violacea]|uniref:type IV pilus modification PilV family protein n=1 Tax=Thiocystis violacea TaxID=13725 RepID=UPI0019089AD6|nr:hypothetical protein [Thiocystis violacea]MBK1717493.1 hypothetical protein [Thiocystis violacea]
MSDTKMRRKARPGPGRTRTQHGFSLNEALISLTVLTSGLLALAQFQGDLHENRRSTKAQTTAVNLALDKIEELRGQAAIDYAGLRDGSDTPPATTGDGTTFSRRWTVTSHLDPSFKEIAVVAEWPSSDGALRSAGTRAFLTPSRPFTENPNARAQSPSEPEIAEESADEEAPASTPPPEASSLQEDEIPRQTATCLCVRNGGDQPAVADASAADPICSSDCCETTWTNLHDGDCWREECPFVAQCRSG